MSFRAGGREADLSERTSQSAHCTVRVAESMGIAALPVHRRSCTNNKRVFPNLLSQFPAPSTRVAHHGVVVPSAVRSNVQLLYSFPSMKNGNWHRRPSVVVQFAHGVSGVVDGLGLGLLLEPVEAEHGCNKSPEAISAQLESVAD